MIEQCNQTFLNRFWSKVSKSPNENTCWEWQGSRVNGRYGKISSGGKRGLLLLTHRAAYEIATGKDPGNLKVLHSCDNPRCCNSAHLSLGSSLDNSQDMVSKNRQNKGEKVPSAKLNSEAIPQIRALYATGGYSQKAIALLFGVSQGAIFRVLTGETWKHIQAPNDSESVE